MKNKIKYFCRIILCLACFTGFTSICVNAQIKKGLDIDGEHVYDMSGISVSMSADGNTVAIGAHGNSGIASASGHVRVFYWSEVAWLQKGQDINGEAALDYSGFSVSLSNDGNTAAIGAISNDGNGSNSGHVRIYSWNGVAWSQKGSDIDGEFAGDEFGTSVSLSADGNMIAIGASYNTGNGIRSGHVRVYNWNGTNWSQQGLDIDGEDENDRSGYSVSMSEDGLTIAIGSPENYANNLWGAGQVRVFYWNGGAWVQKGMDIDGQESWEKSGSSVSISSDGNTVAIGAPENDENGDRAGAVRIYFWNGSTWVLKGQDLFGLCIEDYFGRSVSLSSDGNSVAIGAPSAGTGGYARAYYWNGESWVKNGLDINEESVSVFSGTSVSLSDDGCVLTIGDPYNSGNGDCAGNARVYIYCSPNSSIDYHTACDSFAWIDGNVYTESNNTATFTLLNSEGEDSVVTLSLVIYHTPDCSVTQYDYNLVANMSDANYQWLDCNNNFAPLFGETNQYFAALDDGCYAVEVSQNGCVDTSYCFNVITINISRIDSKPEIVVSPNPTSGKIKIQFGHEYSEITVNIYTIYSQLVHAEEFKNCNTIEFDICEPPGTYYLTVFSNKIEAVLKVVKY